MLWKRDICDDDDELVVTLNWQYEGPLRAQKIYTFRRGQYGIQLNLTLENQADVSWSGVPYVQLFRHHIPVKRSYTSVDSYSFTGPVLYDGNQYEKLDVDDLVTDPVNQELAGGWLASIQHHFLAAAVPPAEDVVRYQAITRGSDYLLTALSREVREISPGESLTYPVKLFIGPKLQDQLAVTGNELELTVDYGKLTILSQPLFWLLTKIHGFVNNWYHKSLVQCVNGYVIHLQQSHELFDHENTISPTVRFQFLTRGEDSPPICPLRCLPVK